MGMASPSGGITRITTNDKITGSSLKKEGTPNSRADLYKNGRLIQSRWYDPNGRAVRDRDYEHSNADGTHTFPHDHEWDWSRVVPRGKETEVDPNFY